MNETDRKPEPSYGDYVKACVRECAANDTDRKPDDAESARLDVDAVVSMVGAHWPQLGAIGAGGLDALNDALGDGLDADAVASFVKTRWPKLGAIGAQGLARLNDALKCLESELISIEVWLDPQPRDAVFRLLLAMREMYSAVTYDPCISGTRSPAGERAFRLLINSFAALDDGVRPKIFSPRKTGGKPRITLDEENKRFWAAVAMTLRARRTMKSLESAGREIAKELGIPRDDQKIVAGWRKSIVSGKRGFHEQAHFRDTVAAFSDPTKPPYCVSADAAETVKARLEKHALDRAKEAAAEVDLLDNVQVE